MTRTSQPKVYHDDFFAWTQEQAEAIRGLTGIPVGSRFDIEHVAEEIEDLGKRDLREVRSYLSRLFQHLMKIDASPLSLDVPHWRSEARQFRRAAIETFSPSMRRALDVAVIWQKTRNERADDLADFGGRLNTPLECPLILDDVLRDDLDLDAILSKLAALLRPDDT